MVLSVLESKAKENYDLAETIKDTRKNSAISRYYYACLQAIKYYLISNEIVSEEDINGAKQSTHQFLIAEYINSFRDHQDFRSNNAKFRKIHNIREARNKADYDDETNYCSSSYSREYSNVISDIREFVRILRNYSSAPF
ncbi:MAG: HEPN domain-containing protein [Candidatus Cloacimonas sp.]|jgi:hypothetical protein|nr:HEPN domain-containing protein [Candidatus Cloacimonas sp.]